MQVYISYSELLLYVLYCIYIYTMQMLRAWPLFIVTIVLMDQSLIMCAWYINHVFSETTMLILSLHPPSFNVTSPFLLSTGCGWWAFEYHDLMWLMHGFILSSLTACIMDLVMNDAHIIYYHMDVLWLFGLAWSYSSHPNCLLVQCWVHAVVLFPNIATPEGPHVFHLLKSLLGWRVTWMRVHFVTLLWPL